MKITFHDTSRHLGSKHVAEAKRCVLVHGSSGKGDEFGSRFIEACKAEYVQTCVQRELAQNPNNQLAKDLQQHFNSALQ